MHVVLDSNIFVSDFRMEGTAFRVLLSAAPRVGITLCVPQLVLDEVVNKYREQLRGVAAKYVSVARSWQRMTTERLPPIADDCGVAEHSHAYAEHLRTTLASVDAKILPYPDVSHEKLVRRALERRRPFAKGGRGYRDALIWEVLLGLCLSDGREVCFVTRNSKDFGKGPEPHPHLAADLTNSHLRIDRLAVVPSLDELNNTHLVQHLRRVDRIVDLLSAEQLDQFSLRDWASAELCDLLDDNELGDILANVEQNHVSVSVSSIKKIDFLQVDDVRLLPAGELLVAATISGTVELAVDGDPESYYNYEDVRELWGTEPPSEYSSMWFPADARVAFSLVLQGESYDVLSAEIDSVEGEAMEVEINVHPRRRS